MKNLISMTDFILEQDKSIHRCDNKTFAKSVLKYAKFLKQPLELWMFVPCDEECKLLIEPIEHNKIYWSIEYQQAKERCLFSDIDFKYFSKYKILEIKGKYEYTLRMFETRTIEDLVKYNLTLTATTQKQIGL